MDDVCPAPTIFAAYNAYGGPKDLVVYEWDDHDSTDAKWNARCVDLATTLLPPLA
jgi:cephalosporin-C deacetylase